MLVFPFALGGVDRKIVILFETEKMLRQFVDNGYDATAQARSTMGDETNDLEVGFENGRSIFVLTSKG